MASVPEERRAELVGGQTPFALILGCLDSRAPAELVFDQGLGDLAVVRVAGNIAGPSQVASVEIAAQMLGVRLVVVLGHSGCAAVRLTLDGLVDSAQAGERPFGSIQDAIRPAIADWLSDLDPADSAECMPRAVRSNVMHSVEVLRRDSAILSSLIAEEGLQVVGAEYSLKTGAVEFLDA